MTTIQMVYLLGAGLSAVSQIGITLAYSFAPAKDISIFTYASIIFTAIFRFILFGETPDFYALSVMSLLLVQAIICSKRHDDKPL